MDNNNNYREEFLSKLQWRTAKSGGTCKSDITITVTKDNRLNFTFRNECYEFISSTGYFTICTHKNRLLFKETPAGRGYSPRTNSSNASNNKYSQMVMASEADKAFEGNYELKYDDFLELYYIER